MKYTVLFENDDLFAIDKPVGIATIAERRKEVTCLIETLRRETGLPLMVVHRLDKEVSGVVVFAKHPDAHRTLNLAFDRREVHKTYTAVVHGNGIEEKGTIEKPIRQFGSGRMGVDESRGQACVTRFAVERSSARFSWLKLMPITGRRHQLRVHLYSIGHPIVGDPLYGDKSIQKEFPRLFLHASRIEFTWQEERLKIASPLPEVFQSMSNDAGESNRTGTL